MSATKVIALAGVPELPEGYWWNVTTWPNKDGVEVTIRCSTGTAAYHTTIVLFGSIRDRHVRRAAWAAYRKLRRRTCNYVGAGRVIGVKP